jgi:hypothetical protein
MSMEELQRACDDALIEGMTPGLKAATLAALEKGAPPAGVLRRVRAQTGGPQAGPGGLTYLAVEALVERWLKEQAPRRPTAKPAGRRRKAVAP